MEQKLNQIIQKLIYLEKRLQSIEETLHIIPPVAPEKLPLVKQAAQEIHKLPQTSTQFLQKEFSLSLHEAVELYQELEKRGMVKTIETNNDPLQPLKIGSVSKYKIKKFLHEHTK